MSYLSQTTEPAKIAWLFQFNCHKKLCKGVIAFSCIFVGEESWMKFNGRLYPSFHFHIKAPTASNTKSIVTHLKSA